MPTDRLASVGLSPPKSVSLRCGHFSGDLGPHRHFGLKAGVEPKLPMRWPSRRSALLPCMPGHLVLGPSHGQVLPSIFLLLCLQHGQFGGEPSLSSQLWILCRLGRCRGRPCRSFSAHVQTIIIGDQGEPVCTLYGGKADQLHPSARF